jgi:glyoxylase-like metal-dependent hydrolase (beta-lactamase superfamily II)
MTDVLSRLAAAVTVFDGAKSEQLLAVPNRRKALRAATRTLLGALLLTACAPDTRAPRDGQAPAAATASPATASPATAATDSAAATEPSWCTQVPRPVNQRLRQVDVGSPWFTVYEADRGVYAIVEPRQFQETIAYLIVGAQSALLFDTGLGMVPLRPVVERLTSRPVRVLNSHTHYDHVGGNTEFREVLARDTPYTRRNQAGFPHAEVAGEAAPGSFCGAAPAGLDTATYRTRAWQASRRVGDGDTLNLGGRVLEVLAVPGHTPDATALLDREHGLLFTGDTYYDAHVWLFAPETDLDAYERSIARLVALAPAVRTLLPAHNTAAAQPERLAEMQRAIRDVRAGRVAGRPEMGTGVAFHFPHFAILTSTAILAGQGARDGQGGSGLPTPPAPKDSAP